jgi:hypothetical protein
MVESGPMAASVGSLPDLAGVARVVRIDLGAA